MLRRREGVRATCLGNKEVGLKGCIYTYIHTYFFIYSCIHTYVYIHMYIYICAYVYMYICVYTVVLGPNSLRARYLTLSEDRTLPVSGMSQESRNRKQLSQGLHFFAHLRPALYLGAFEMAGPILGSLYEGSQYLGSYLVSLIFGNSDWFQEMQ